MDAKEHAEIWRKAAKVVADMDPRHQWASEAIQFAQQQRQAGLAYQSWSRQYCAEEAAMWQAFSAAASVLAAIAAEYEKAVQTTSVS